MSAQPDPIDRQATPASDPTPATGAPPAVRVKVVQNGPLQIKGAIELVDHDGNTYDTGGRKTVFLCRCGGSTTKPFCDGTHSRVGFAAAERAVTDADASTGGSAAAGRQTGGKA